MSAIKVTAITTPVSAESAPPDTFTVDDSASANWLVRKIVEARAYAKRVKLWADVEVKRAQNEEQFFIQRYGRQLEAWARNELTAARRKCVKLPAGTVGYRTEPPKLDVMDEEKLIAWCRKTLPDALRVETHVLKSLVKEHVKETGECPDGVDIGGGQQRFYIK